MQPGNEHPEALKGTGGRHENPNNFIAGISSRRGKLEFHSPTRNDGEGNNPVNPFAKSKKANRAPLPSRLAVAEET